MTVQEMSKRTTTALRMTGWSLAALLLITPAAAMTMGVGGVNWSPGDFAFAAVMFAIVGGLFELAARASANIAYRAAVVLAVACAFLQIWINLAVGIIGNEDDPANTTYFIVVIVAITASAVAAGRAQLMGRAMIVVMATQILFSAVHLIDGHFTAAIDLFFVSLWLLSSRLFTRAAREIGEPAKV